nr:reverse transcriptase domain-containing protein [Tanacetum cinerariifolium]
MVDEMFERVKAFIQGEMAAGSAKMVRPFQGDKGNTHSLWDNFTSLIKTIKEILAMEGISFPELPPLIENPKKQNLNKLCDYHEDKGHNTNDCCQLKKQIEEAVASSKLAHLVRDICWSNQKSKKQRRNDVKVISMIAGGRNHKRPYKEERSGLTKELTFPAIPQNSLTDKPIILEGMIEGHQEGIVRRVHYPECVTNAKLIKLINSTWQVQMDYSSLNKICAKDMFPFLMEEEELASLMGYQYKCFLWLPKDDSQIRMAKDDEKKTGFHTEEGVYYFTHMPKGLKNSVVTLQSMMEKVLANQKVQNVEEEEVLLLCLCQGNEKISSVLFVERNGTQKPVSYVSRPLQGIEACYNLTEKMVQALIHTTRSLRTTFRKQKVRVATDGPMKEMLNSSKRRKISKMGSRTKNIRYLIQTSELGAKLQAELTPTPRAWQLNLSKETIKEGSDVGMILINPEAKTYSYAICLNFEAPKHIMNYVALLAGLVASTGKGMKDLHVFIDLQILVDQVEGT